jgi:hypothetical protein
MTEPPDGLPSVSFCSIIVPCPLTAAPPRSTD